MSIESLNKQIDAAFRLIEQKEIETNMIKLKEQSMATNFWDDPVLAQIVMADLANKQKLLNTWQKLQHTWQNFLEIKEIMSEAEQIEEFAKIEAMVNKAKIDLFLSNEYDDYNAIITISVGAGGVDAADWSEMMMKILLNYCKNKNWQTSIIDCQLADIAGIKNATIRVSDGYKVFGYLKSESGLHRLVRRSPFNSGNTRETSFVSVEVVPEINETKDLIIDIKDLRIDTYRSQGAGGQHVNTTDSAIRITHLPSGMVVQCQNERSQIQNKNQAMKVLYSRLAEKKRQEDLAKQESLKAKKMHSSFGGGHIRSYVLDDKYIKDQRTGLKTSQVDKVLAGELDEFIESFILQEN